MKMNSQVRNKARSVHKHSGWVSVEDFTAAKWKCVKNSSFLCFSFSLNLLLEPHSPRFIPFLWLQYHELCWKNNTKATWKWTRWIWCINLRRDSTGRTSGPSSVLVRTSKGHNLSLGTTSPGISLRSAHPRPEPELTTTVSNKY